MNSRPISLTLRSGSLNSWPIIIRRLRLRVALWSIGSARPIERPRAWRMSRRSDMWKALGKWYPHIAGGRRARRMGARFCLSIEGTTRMALDGWDSPSACANLWSGSRGCGATGAAARILSVSVSGTMDEGAHSNGQHARAHALYHECLASSIRLNNPNTSYRLTTRVARRWSPRARRAQRLRTSITSSRTTGWTFTAILLCFTALMIPDAAHLACARSVS